MALGNRARYLRFLVEIDTHKIVVHFLVYKLVEIITNCISMKRLVCRDVQNNRTEQL